MRTKDHPLVGRFVTCNLTRPSRFGHYGGFVRAVTLDRKGRLVGLSVQMPGGPNMIDGKTGSARYRGEVLLLKGPELLTVQAIFRGKVRPVVTS